MSNFGEDSSAVAVAALAVQVALAEAKFVAAGGPSSAWSISASIAAAAAAAAATNKSRAVIFNIAAKQAARAFEAERKKAGATVAVWGAFTSARSMHMNALALGVFSVSLSKSETAKAIKTAKEVIATDMLALAKESGLI